MRTPAGSECPHYYEDFHRGRDQQECRLIGANPESGRWAPDLCGRCPAPRIVLANACPHMLLKAHVRPGILGIGRGVDISAHCERAAAPVEAPQIGCGRCHEPLDFPLAPP